MKTYLICTGAFFGLAGLAHFVRLFVEPGHSFSVDAGFFAENLALFTLGAGVAVWSATLLHRLRVAS